MGSALENFRRTGKEIERAMGGPTRLGPGGNGKGLNGRHRIGGGVNMSGYVGVPPGISKGVRIDARVKRRGKDEWDISTEIYGRGG